MKKQLAVLLTLCLCIILLAGCNNNQTSSSAPNLDAGALADKALAALSPKAEMVEVTQSTLSNYYSLDPKVVRGHKIYVSSAWTAEEVAVFVLVDDTAATVEAAKAMVEQREKALADSFDGYLPEELAILQSNAAVYIEGPLVAFVSGSAEGVSEALATLRAAYQS